MESIINKIIYQKILLEDPDKSEKENRYSCFIHYLIPTTRILHIQTFVCNGESGEGKKLLLALLKNLISTGELNSRATIVLTPDAEAASFFVTKDIEIDQKKLEEFYEKLSLKQRNENDPDFYAYVGKVIDKLKKRIAINELLSSIQESSMPDQSEGGKRTRKFRKIKKRKYRKSTGKLIRFSSR